MLLAVDVGNTQTVVGLYDGDRLSESWRVATEAERTGDEVAALLARLLELSDLGFEDLTGVVLSSTVPLLVRSYEQLADSANRVRIQGCWNVACAAVPKTAAAIAPAAAYMSAIPCT